MPSEPTIVPASLDLKSALLDMADEFSRAGEDRYDAAMVDFDTYFSEIESRAAGSDLSPGRVPESQFWLVSESRILGRSKLRHHLNAALEKEGGHIGYDIRPSERRKGLGTLILKLTLEKARTIGLERVLVTCDADNAGSAKVIENNGGILVSEGVSEKTERPILRYWIRL